MVTRTCLRPEMLRPRASSEFPAIGTKLLFLAASPGRRIPPGRLNPGAGHYDEPDTDG
jgi:hypothetical protein